jgi:hypothetical protein
LARPYLFLAAAVLAFVGMGVAFERAIDSLRWGNREWVPDVVLTAVALACVGHALSSFRSSLVLGDLKPSRLPFSADRRRRLNKALAFFPEPLPANWSSVLSPLDTVLCRVVVDGDVVLYAWTSRYDVGDRFFVTLTHEREAHAVDDTRAAEILTHFRGVTAFAELAKTPGSQLDRLPGARTWVSLPLETVRAMPVPSAAPELSTTPLNAHLAAIRRHLPLKLPPGWAVPLAVTEQRFGWKHGAWFIEHEGVVSIVIMFLSGGRPKLSVTLFRPDHGEVGEFDAMEVLKHFRGVREFLQTEMTDPEQIPGARSYVSEIDFYPTTTVLN